MPVEQTNKALSRDPWETSIRQWGGGHTEALSLFWQECRQQLGRRKERGLRLESTSLGFPGGAVVLHDERGVSSSLLWRRVGILDWISGCGVGAEAVSSAVLGSVEIKGCICSVKQGDLQRVS